MRPGRPAHLAVKAALSIYNCSAVSVGDGDTFRCLGDVRPIAPDVTAWVPKVRLAGVNTPERGQPGWEEARERLREWLERGPFNLICYGRDKYGRLLADAERGTGLLSRYMLEAPGTRPVAVANLLTTEEVV